MPSFNRIIFAGHLTRDPQLTYLPSNTAVCEFGMAANRKWKEKSGEAREEVCFVDCKSFGKQAETLNQYVSKGKPLLIEGRLKFDQWDAKDGGGKRSKLYIIVESFTFLGSKGDGDSNGTTGGGESAPVGDGLPF